MHVIIPMDEIASFLKRMREEHQGLGIAFTNGCFDILHRGHVAYLEKARQLADILVLGLNSDPSVRRLKGEKRPYINQDDRSFILSRLEMVDVVTVFDEDTPIDLIRAVRPDVLVKGGDYTPETVVGRDFVESYGGKVAIIPFIEGRSTTNIINKIKTL